MSNLKEKCKNCGMAQYMPAFNRHQCLAMAEGECFPVTQSMNFPDDEVEGEEPEYEEPDIPLYLEYEGLYGSSEMDDCRTDCMEDSW